MRLRVVLLETNDAISDSLGIFLEELGHEVVTDAGESCPHFHSADATCSSEHSCADAVILGQYFPGLRGIELIERRRRGGCKGMSENVALLCLPWSDGDHHRAEALGCRYFETPLNLDELSGWLEQVTRRTDPRRRLRPLPAKGVVSAPAADAP